MNKPLNGRTILITRTIEGNKLERKKLEDLGAKVIEFPLIEIKEPSSLYAIENAIKQISRYDWIIFTSANGVRSFFEKMKSKKDIKAKFACVGPETREALEDHGFQASFVPKEYLTEELASELEETFDLKGKEILLARAEESNKNMAKILEKSGAIVTEAPVYRTVPRIEKDDNILELVTDITLTSPSTVKGLVANFSVKEIRSRKIKVHCIGPVTAASAKEAGLEVITSAKVHTVDGLVSEIALRKLT
ncbi:MAG: uroporphyrinogen-III synthase [Nitrososphaerales archaeon]